MCLDVKGLKVRKKPKKALRGWKFVGLPLDPSVGWYSPMRGNSGVQPWETWVTDKNRIDLIAGYSWSTSSQRHPAGYTAGFHCFYYEKDAMSLYEQNVRDSICRTIVPVWCENIVAEGYQRSGLSSVPAFVCRKMWVGRPESSPIRGWER